MDKISLYIRESYNELVHKVTWPSLSSLQSSTILVIIGSAILALIIFGMDGIAKAITDFIYGLVA